MQKILKVLPPIMPNFYHYEMPAGKREDGFVPNNNTYPIENFTKEEAEEFGELMKQTFINHWESKKNDAK